MNDCFGLIGKKLSHSYSPYIHSLISDYEYKLYELKEEEVKDFILNTPLSAFNVTIPYKKTVIDCLDELSETAEKLNSVNTIVKRDNKIKGYNTDYFGFSYTLEHNNIIVKGKTCIVLGGYGGAGTTICSVLSDLGANEIVPVSRTGEYNYNNVYEKNHAEIIINCTPVGMYPNPGTSPIDLKRFPETEAVIDLIYNPDKTTLLLQAEDLNIKTVNGLTMLVAQAFKAASLFLNKEQDYNKIKEVTEKVRFAKKNISLIGMPGVGKTTLGKALAAETGRKFIDTDYVIESKTGRSCKDIIINDGEERFRRIETKVLSSISGLQGYVIAYGGGVVTRPENRELLKRNSTVVFLDSNNVNKLPKLNRPISAKFGNAELYGLRLPKYIDFSDYRYDLTRDLNKDTENILNLIK